MVVLCLTGCPSGGELLPPPPGVEEIATPWPLEISGVAAVPGGFAVVGDSTPGYGLIWPEGERFVIHPPVGDLEALDVAVADNGEELWLVAGEDEGVVADRTGGRAQLPPEFREVCNRGLEGLAIRPAASDSTGRVRWEVAALWEGGFFRPPCWQHLSWRPPRVVLFHWRAGQTRLGPHRSFDLQVPIPSPGQRFRAPDLVWIGDELLVLLSSQDERDGTFGHTWLQGFDLEGRVSGPPVKLEELWGEYRSGRNWEALDWTLDGDRLVLGWDALGGHRAVALFRLPSPPAVSSPDVAPRAAHPH